jgi:hypothetical protein
MKTQLLEDIGQSTKVPLAPSDIVANPTANKQLHKLAPAGNAQPAKPRPDLGVWRQKPAAQPLISPAQEPDQQPATLGLHEVFEEIAALEAQLVHPGQQHEPVIAPVEAVHELPTRPAEPLPKPAIAQADATLPLHATQPPTAPQDPLFDFTPILPAQQAAAPFTPAPTGLARSRRRYLLWAACVLSGALLIQGGRWLYQERNDAGSLARISDEAREKPQVDTAVERAMASQELAPGPGSDPSGTPAVPARRPVSTLPPLVMLEPESTDTEGKRTPPLAAGRVAHQTAPKPEPVAEQAPASASPKQSSPTVHKPSDAATQRATERAKREPVPQVASASAIEAERPAERDTTMAATLKACREHGYHAAQCIKRACEVTQYGFVCRGR